MRKNLIELMARAGDTPYDVQRKIGVPRTTTWRFVSGGQNEPRNATIKKWAKLYNVSESQLRGDVPIDRIPVISEPQELKDLMRPEEYDHLSNIKKINPVVRGLLFKLSSVLADGSQSDNSGSRNDEMLPNSQLRTRGVRYKSPPKKSRIKEPINATKQTGTS